MIRRAISKKNKKRFLILGGTVLVIVLILYFSVIRSPGSALSPPDVGVRDRAAVPEINTTPFESGVLDKFDVWNSLPVEVGPTGKDNPFSQ